MACATKHFKITKCTLIHKNYQLWLVSVSVNIFLQGIQGNIGLWGEVGPRGPRGDGGLKGPVGPRGVTGYPVSSVLCCCCQAETLFSQLGLIFFYVVFLKAQF